MGREGNMSIQLEITDAKNRFAELLERARSGEEFILADSGKPVVRIAPTGTGVATRVFGEFAGKITMSEDFAAPLSSEEVAEWER